MADIQLVDVSLRDGNQSLWGAVGVTTRMVEGVAPLIDRVGYRAVEFASSTALAVAVRFHRENPWHRLRRAREIMPNTPLGFLTSGKRFITFYRTPDVLFELAFQLLVRNGMKRIWVIDPMHDMDGAKRTAEMAKRAGFEEVVAGVCYTTSPFHSDDHYAEKIAELDTCDSIDSLYIKDPAGLLTPDRVRTLVPRLQSVLKNKRLDEIHTHCTTGLAPLTVLVAAEYGITTIHCALPPLADGSSHPGAQRLVANLVARGHGVDVDVDAMDAASDYLKRQARMKSLPFGTPNEYDEAYYRHTIPGGLRSTLARQLAEMGKADLFDRVIEESVQVREDLGWPIVMTPFAQYIVTQATLNVMSGERYHHISDEVVDMIRGDFGPLPGRVNPQVMDRAMQTKRGRASAANGDDGTTIADLRRKFGARISDEELLLRAVMPGEQVDAMAAAKAAAGTSIRQVVEALRNREGPTSIAVSDGNSKFAITIRGRA